MRRAVAAMAFAATAVVGFSGTAWAKDPTVKSLQAEVTQLKQELAAANAKIDQLEGHCPGAVAVPALQGERLDQAEATLKEDHLGYKVFGGGVFGVVVASDWTVCTQTPAAGMTATTVDLTVARNCT
jgi:hypothetical protein